MNYTDLIKLLNEKRGTEVVVHVRCPKAPPGKGLRAAMRRFMDQPVGEHDWDICAELRGQLGDIIYTRLVEMTEDQKRQVAEQKKEEKEKGIYGHSMATLMMLPEDTNIAEAGLDNVKPGEGWATIFIGESSIKLFEAELLSITDQRQGVSVTSPRCRTSINWPDAGESS